MQSALGEMLFIDDMERVRAIKRINSYNHAASIDEDSQPLLLANDAINVAEYH